MACSSPSAARRTPRGATIHAVFVPLPSRRRGVGTELLDALAVKFMGHAIDPGGLTQDGKPFWENWVRSNNWMEVNDIIWLEDADSDFEDD